MLDNNIENTLKQLTISAITMIVKENDTLEMLLGVISSLATSRASINFVQFEQMYKREEGDLIIELKLSYYFLHQSFNSSNKSSVGLRLNSMSWQFMLPIPDFDDPDSIDIINFLSSATINVDFESVDKVILDEYKVIINDYLLEVLSLIPNEGEEDNEDDD